MTFFERATNAVNAAISAAAAIALGCAAIHVVADALMTKFLHTPIPGTADIVTTYYMVSLFFLPLGLAEAKYSHINAEILHSAASKSGKRILDLLNYAALTAFIALFTWEMIVKAIAQTKVGEMVDLGSFLFLIWPARWIAVLGCTAMLLVCLGRLFKLAMSGEDILTLQAKEQAVE